MTFLAKPIRLNRDDMVNYILAIPKTGMKPNPNTGAIWDPKGVTWHNTAGPTLAQWAEYTQAEKDSWGANYDQWCKATEHWHSGPHFVSPPEEWSEVLCDLQADGIHCSCDNTDHFGCETVGDFAPGKEDPLTGAGAIAVAGAANIIAALCARFDWDPHTHIKFHRDCPRDGHPCPGAQLTNEHAIGLVVARLAEIKEGINSGKYKATQEVKAVDADAPVVPVEQPPKMLELPEWPPTYESAPWFYNSAAVAFNTWKSFGVTNPFALGMVAQFEAESAFKLAAGDNDTAFGMGQWHEPRITEILKGCGIDIKTAPVADQVRAAWWELNNLEKAALADIQACTTAADAGAAACTYYERAGAADAAQRRGLMAERWATYFTSTNPSILTSNPVPAQTQPVTKSATVVRTGVVRLAEHEGSDHVGVLPISPVTVKL